MEWPAKIIVSTKWCYGMSEAQKQARKGSLMAEMKQLWMFGLLATLNNYQPRHSPVPETTI